MRGEVDPVRHDLVRECPIVRGRWRPDAQDELRRQRAENERHIGDVRGDRRVGRRVGEFVAVNRAACAPLEFEPLPDLLANHQVAGQRPRRRIGLLVGRCRIKLQERGHPVPAEHRLRRVAEFGGIAVGQPQGIERITFVLDPSRKQGNAHLTAPREPCSRCFRHDVTIDVRRERGLGGIGRKVPHRRSVDLVGRQRAQGLDRA